MPQHNKRPAIISLGEVLWDLFPDGERFGGAPANFACHAALAGGDVKMVSAVGNDSHGSEAIRILSSYGIDTSLMQVSHDAPTGSVSVQLDDAGKPEYQIRENTAWDRIGWSDPIGLAVEACDAVYFGTLGQRSDVSRQTIRRCVELAREAGIRRILDVNLRVPFFDDELIRESVALASVLKLSDEELIPVASACGLNTKDDEQLLNAILDKYSLELLVMTQGADGAVLVSKNETIHQPGIPTKVRDTVGAGDSFAATLALGLLNEEDFVPLLKKSCEVAASICGISGAVPQVPAP